MTRLRTWSERVRDMSERDAILGPLGMDRPPAVAVPARGVRMRPDRLVAMLAPRPSPGHRWTAWGPICLVCHCEPPEGRAVAYSFIFGSRACVGACADMVDDLLRIYDRSKRGRWRPASDVHTKTNGARCDDCRGDR